MDNRSRVILQGILLLGMSMVGLPAAAQDAACKPIYDAMLKLAVTQNRQVMTEIATFRKAPLQGESLYTKDKAYVKIDGKWRVRPYNGAEEAKEIQAAAKTGKQTCKLERSESVDGQAADLYVAHSQTGDGTSDKQVWISKQSGVPLKQVIDRSQGNVHVTVQFSYANVQPPTGM